MSNQFPDPSVTTDYIAPNGTQYIYDSTDNKWITVGFIDPILPDIGDGNQQTETTDDRYANVLGETLTGPLHVLYPRKELNVASKGYVDDATTDDYLEHDGDTMEGLLEVPLPSQDNHVVNIEYVELESPDKVTKSGDEMTGTLIFEADPTDLEPVVYKFNPSIVELTDRPGENVTTTLDLGTDLFKIDNNVEIKDTGDFRFNSNVTMSDYVIIRSEFNLDNVLEVNRDVEDYITYEGPITFNKELITKKYIDDIYDLLTNNIPVGTIFFWSSNNQIPTGFFKCEGGAFDITQYPDLHNILQGTQGYNNGKLPDFRNRFACHDGSPNSGTPGSLLSDMNGFTGGSNTVSMTMTAHKHDYTLDKGTHNHAWAITTTGTHTTHTKYKKWTISGTKAGGGSTTKNPNSQVSGLVSTSKSGHGHDIEIDDGHHTTHTIIIHTQSGIGNHNHVLSVSDGDHTTRPLAFLGYWIIKNK